MEVEWESRSDLESKCMINLEEEISTEEINEQILSVQNVYIEIESCRVAFGIDKIEVISVVPRSHHANNLIHNDDSSELETRLTFRKRDIYFQFVKNFGHSFVSM